MFGVAWFTIPAHLGPELAHHDDAGLIETLCGFDISGAVSQAAAVTFLVIALNLGGNVLPWTHPLIILALVASAISGITLIWAESGAKNPVMPLEFLSSRPRGNLVFSHFFTSMTMSSSPFFPHRSLLITSDITADTILFNLPLYVSRHG